MNDHTHRTLTLNEITYRNIYEVTAFFVEEMRNEKRTKKRLQLLVTRVKSQCPRIKKMDYVFDEALWRPDHPSGINNLIQFNVQLHGHIQTFHFRMLMNNGIHQEYVSKPLPVGNAWI